MNPAADPQPPKDIQGDDRWMSQVSERGWSAEFVEENVNLDNLHFGYFPRVRFIFTATPEFCFTVKFREPKRRVSSIMTSVNQFRSLANMCDTAL